MGRDITGALKEKLGIRESFRLLASADIINIFRVYGEFSRSEVVRELGDIYNTKTLDRSLADLEAGGALSVVQAVKNDVSAGATYRITDEESWGMRSMTKTLERRQRHGRGGCRRTLA